MSTGSDKVDIPVELSFLKTRIASARGKDFEVPAGVVRIDIDKGVVGTRGWQVRPQKFTQRSSKFFSDSIEGIDYGPADSLRRALAYLTKNLPSVQVKQYPNNRASIPTGFHGIRVVVRPRKGKSFKEIYVEASNIEKGRAGKRFYCGTETTTNQYRMAQAIERALKARQEMEDELLQRRVMAVNEALEQAKQRDLRGCSRTNQGMPA